MRVLFTNQLYGQGLSSGHNLYELARYLTDKMGWEIHILCGMAGYDGTRTDKSGSEISEGIHIHRAKLATFGKKNMLTRLADYSAFMLATGLELLKAYRFDVVVNLTDPPTAPWVGTLMTRFTKTPQVIWSMDVHPDAMLELGMFSYNHPISKASLIASGLSFRNADKVAAVGRCMKERLLQKGCRPERVEVITVWNDKDELHPVPRKDHPLRRELGIEDKFVFLYSGNIGLMHHFEDILEAAKILEDRRDILFLFVGQGGRFAELESFQKRNGLSNLMIKPYFPRERLCESLSMGDAHLITLVKSAEGVSVPGKLYSAMAVAKPVLFSGPPGSEVARTIAEAACGRNLMPGDVSGLVKVALELADDPEQAHKMGLAGREEFIAKYEREVCCGMWAELLEKTAASRKNSRKQVQP